MEQKHFYFIQSMGAYHLLTEELPHFLVVVAKNDANSSWSVVDAMTITFGLMAVAQTAVRTVLMTQSWRRRRDQELGRVGGRRSDRSSVASLLGAELLSAGGDSHLANLGKHSPAGSKREPEPALFDQSRRPSDCLEIGLLGGSE